jgi:hypothetical protein
MYNEDFTPFDTSRVWVFDGIFVRYHSGLYTMQELSYLGKVTLVLIWFRMVLTQIITQVFKNSPTHQIVIFDW